MIYYYKIGWHDYESSEYIEICHTKEFSEQEIEEMIEEAVVELLISRKGFYGSFDWYDEGNYIRTREKIKKVYKEVLKNDKEVEKYFESSSNKYYTRFHDIFLDAADVMVKKYGFEKIKYKQKISVWGSDQMVKPTPEDKGQREFYNDDVKEKEKEDIFKKIREKYWKRKNGTRDK